MGCIAIMKSMFIKKPGDRVMDGNNNAERTEINTQCEINKWYVALLFIISGTYTSTLMKYKLLLQHRR
jgi:hypothetical protein